MLAYAIRRIIAIIPLLLAVATVTFFLMHAVEGGPSTPISLYPRQPRRTSSGATASTSRSGSSTRLTSAT
jgi:ABC-type microcin C transport system permease subunit YejB